MEQNVLGWVLGAGVVQGLFLASALSILGVRNRTARWLLVAMILGLTVIVFQDFLEQVGIKSGIPINFSGEFFIAPLLYLFACSLSREGLPRPRTRWMYFIPLAASLLWTAYIYYGVGDGRMSLNHPATRDFIIATVPVKVAFYLGVMYLALSRPLSFGGKPTVARRRVRWVRSTMWVAALAGVIGAVSFTAFILWPQRTIDSDNISAIMTVIAIYGLGYFTLFNREILNTVYSVKPQDQSEPEALRLHHKARTFLEHSRASEDPEFTLRDLAAALGTSEKRLSKSLQACTDGGFNGLLNDVRLSTFHRLLDVPGNRSRTVMALAYEAGFNSKATFYRHFQAREGMAPKAYMAQRLETDAAFT